MMELHSILWILARLAVLEKKAPLLSELKRLLFCFRRVVTFTFFVLPMVSIYPLFCQDLEERAPVFPI